MLKLNNINITDNGKKILFDYDVTTSSIKKYFNMEESYYTRYDINVSEVPKSILIIPFLSNIMPIAWFADFDVIVDELDEDFYESIKLVKVEFEKQFSNYNLTGNLIVKKLVNLTI